MATFENYTPSPPPLDFNLNARQYLDQELRRIADVINSFVIYAEPQPEAIARPFDGMIAYADGVNWDPGSGLGFYGYENGTWIKL